MVRGNDPEGVAFEYEVLEQVESAMRTIGIALLVFLCLAIGYATSVLHHDHSQIRQVREECQRAHTEAAKMAECQTDSALRQARQAQLP
jgi:hypothetical protein